jgi:20S proteasome alpha/beta subunit
MTIIVGYKTDTGVWLAADSAGSAGWNRSYRVDKKIFIAHGIGYGYTSSYRMGQILQYHSEEVIRCSSLLTLILLKVSLT